MRYEKQNPSVKCFCCHNTASAHWDGKEESVQICSCCALKVLPALIADATGGGVIDDYYRALNCVLAAYWKAVASRLNDENEKLSGQVEQLLRGA